jgi:hypothetical protein
VRERHQGTYTAVCAWLWFTTTGWEWQIDRKLERGWKRLFIHCSSMLVTGEREGF